MKALLLVIFLVLTPQLFGQVVNFQSKVIQVEDLDPQPYNILIVVDFTNEKIKLYSQEIQVYKFSSLEHYTDEDGQDVYKFPCIDPEGLFCYIYVTNMQAKECIIGIVYDSISWGYYCTAVE